MRLSTTKDIVLLHGNCTSGYHGNRLSFSSTLSVQTTPKRAMIKLFMWYWLIFCVWCSRCSKSTHQAKNQAKEQERKDKRQTHTIKHIIFYLLAFIRFSSWSLFFSSRLPSIWSFLSFSHHPSHVYISDFFSFLSYLWCYVTVSLRLLFVMFSECFIINDPERVSEQ